MRVMASVKTRHLVAFWALWTLLVLYPNPYRLAVSVARIARPPIDASLVGHLVPVSPDEPAELERFVLREYPYQYDWQTYGVPWYFPTVDEALERGTGDCKTRFVILASLMEAKEIPYRQTMSLTHYWVHYEDKKETSIERDEYAFLVRDDEGTRFQVPQEELDHVWDVFREAFWDHMPPGRKALFVSGPVLTVLAGWLRRASRRRIPRAGGTH